MADPESATLVVNGCLFLNVLSFRYLDFEPLARRALALRPARRRLDARAASRCPRPKTRPRPLERPHLLSEETVPDFESLIALDDEDDED